MKTLEELLLKGLAGNLWVIWWISSALVFLPASLSAQDEPTSDKKAILAAGTADTLRGDSSKIIEDAPLDIAQDRGLFIVTPDRKMQLRVLGSVRYLVVFDNTNFISKNSFNTYEIPTGDDGQYQPSYYNGLDQTRLGFEITRRTSKGDVFIRLEMDFAGDNGYRIRHAYGQFGRFTLGQTWSLFSQVNALPATVDFGGPTGSVVVRTPQIRYTDPDFFSDAKLSIGFEYARPELSIPDSLRVETFQLIPDVTFRIDKSVGWGSFQLSAVVPMLTARNGQGDFILRPGFGVSTSAVIDSWANGTWYLQGVGGRAITRFFDEFGGKGLDILFDPESSTTAVPFALGFYVTYEHSWRSNLYSNFTYGFVNLEKVSFAPEGIYHWGDSFHFNTFWDIADGAKIGMEAIFGSRMDKDREKGRAFRINLLAYYDF